MKFFRKKRDAIAAVHAKLDAAIMQLSFYRAQNAELLVANKSLVRELKAQAVRVRLLEENLNEAIRRLTNV